MDEIVLLQQLARESEGGYEPLGVDLRPAIRMAIEVRQQQLRRRSGLIRLAAFIGGCGLAAAALLTISLYTVTSMARDLSWNASVLHLMNF